jgi:transposase
MSEKVIKTIILNIARTMVPSSKVGRPHKSHEDLLEQFLRILRTGAPWRDVRNIDFRTAHMHFIRWARLGVFESAYQKLLRLVRRPRRDRSFLVVDTTFVKNVFGTDVVGRNPTDRGRKATKMVALVDEKGLPHRLGFVPANMSDFRTVSSVLPLPKGKRGCRFYADKGFDSNEIRQAVRQSGLLPRVPRRGTPTPAWWERRRRVVERFFGALDKNRRLIVRYDKTIDAYRGWTWLACCRLTSRHLILSK